MNDYGDRDGLRYFAPTEHSKALKRASEVLGALAEGVRAHADKNSAIFKKLPDMDLLGSLLAGLYEVLTDTEQSVPMENIFHDVRIHPKSPETVFSVMASLDLVAHTLHQALQLMTSHKDINFKDGALYYQAHCLLKKDADPRDGLQKFLDFYSKQHPLGSKGITQAFTTVIVNNDHLIGGAFALSLTGSPCEAAQLYTIARTAELFDDQLTPRDLSHGIYQGLLGYAVEASARLVDEFTKLKEDLPNIGKPDNVVGFTSFLQDVQAEKSNDNN